MKKVRALELYFMYDSKDYEYKFFCGKAESSLLVDLRGQLKINNDKPKLEAKNLFLTKVWEEQYYVMDDIYASISSNLPSPVKSFLTRDMCGEDYLQGSTVICEVGKVLYDVDKLLKLERNLNKTMEL